MARGVRSFGSARTRWGERRAAASRPSICPNDSSRTVDKAQRYRGLTPSILLSSKWVCFCTFACLRATTQWVCFFTYAASAATRRWVRLCIGRSGMVTIARGARSGFVSAFRGSPRRSRLLIQQSPQSENSNIGGHNLASFGILQPAGKLRMALFPRSSDSEFTSF